MKEEETNALNVLCDIKDKYTDPVQNHTPPYAKLAYHLTKEDFPDQEVNTNNLSQIVFIEYLGTTICICGDLERAAWDILLTREHIQTHLGKTDIFVASHHGRENGYHEGIFDHCSPEVIIISDKGIIHGTQETMAQKYGNHISDGGITF